MKNSNTILEMMISHHTLIDLLLVAFKDSLEKNIETAEKAFEEFRWELEKHIFVEEKVIFKHCEKMGSEMCEIVMGLVKEHDQMFEALNKVKDDLALRNKIVMTDFQGLLTKHCEVEEKTLYPALDEKLNKSEKEAIVARINEVPLTVGEAEAI